MSIDSIIKQAMIDAGMNPEIEKKATGNKLADDLYALAAECEKLGSARVGVAKSAEQSCLRDLTKAYLFQRMLKSAVEDRLGVADTAFEKSAGEHASDIRYEYIEAFEKLAAEKSAIDMKTLAGVVGAGLGMAGVAEGIQMGIHALGGNSPSDVLRAQKMRLIHPFKSRQILADAHRGSEGEGNILTNSFRAKLENLTHPFRSVKRLADADREGLKGKMPQAGDKQP